MAKKKPEPEVSLVPTLEGERVRTIALLSEQFAQDVLTIEDFESRVESAYRAGSVPELRELIRDLVPAPAPAPLSSAPAKAAILAASEFAPERERIRSIMSSTRRGGVWRPARHIDVFALMTETELDLTQAVLEPGVTEIKLLAIMAQVKIIVAPGVRVVLQAGAFMSEVSDETMDPPAVGSGAPVIRITGRAIMTELRAVVRRRELDAGE